MVLWPVRVLDCVGLKQRGEIAKQHVNNESFLSCIITIPPGRAMTTDPVLHGRQPEHILQPVGIHFEQNGLGHHSVGSEYNVENTMKLFLSYEFIRTVFCGICLGV